MKPNRRSAPAASIHQPGPTSAIVIGAGMAGLLAARVLSEHVDRVTILERDRLPDAAVSPRGVPQGRHAHVLLGSGQQLLDGWFPGLLDELVDRGAVAVDSADVVWFQAGALRVRTSGHTAMSMSRPLLETTVRGACSHSAGTSRSSTASASTDPSSRTAAWSVGRLAIATGR